MRVMAEEKARPNIRSMECTVEHHLTLLFAGKKPPLGYRKRLTPSSSDLLYILYPHTWSKDPQTLSTYDDLVGGSLCHSFTLIRPHRECKPCQRWAQTPLRQPPTSTTTPAYPALLEWGALNLEDREPLAGLPTRTLRTRPKSQQRRQHRSRQRQHEPVSIPYQPINRVSHSRISESRTSNGMV